MSTATATPSVPTGGSTCPYCEGGKIQGMEADPSGKREYKVDQACEKCAGTGTLDCQDSSGSNLTLGDKVKMEFTVGNLHRRLDGGVNVEVIAQGDKSHFAIVDSASLTKV